MAAVQREKWALDKWPARPLNRVHCDSYEYLPISRIPLSRRTNTQIRHTAAHCKHRTACVKAPREALAQ